jgi:nucleotide-binding universal stress UspA family protein/predicted transcriptional regulator
MFEHILAAVDGSESSLKAADVALELAALSHARLDILSVEETAPRYVATSEESKEEHSAAVSYYSRLQAPLAEQAGRRGVQVQSAVRSGHEVQAILDYIGERRCDLLVIGHQGHSGVWGAFLGSTADKLVSHVSSSILVVRAKGGKMLYRRVLVALDGSPLSWQAFQTGLQMAKSLRASLRVISVVEGPRTPPAASPAPSTNSGELRWDWGTYMQQTQVLAQAQAAAVGVHLETTIREGHASSVLIDAVREDANDLLLLGATGHEHPWSSTTGGTARKVANEAPCAVMLVRPPTQQQRVRDLMSAEVATVVPEMSLAEVISRLIEQGVKLLTVVNEQQQVVGVITLGSLLAQDQAYRHLDLQQAASADLLIGHLRQLLRTEKAAREVMIKQPIIVKDDVGIEQAVRWMISQRVTRVPVVDAGGKLVGMLDQEHLLRHYTGLSAAPETPFVQENTPSRSAPRTVGEATMTQVPLVASDMPLTEVLQQVQSTPLRRVIVINADGVAIGVIADRDILASRGLVTRRNPVLAFAGRFSLRFPEELARRRLSSGPLAAQQVMRPRLFTASKETPVAEAVRLMLAHQIKRLVVVDEAGRPLGLVDRQQLLHSLVEGGLFP